MDIILCLFCYSFSFSFVLLLFLLFCSLKRSLIFEEIKSNYFDLSGNMNIDSHNLMERVRTLVAIKGWDYSVLWKLSQDQRSIELLRCCCAGIEYYNNSGDEEQLLRDSQFLQCRDNIFQHRRSKSCDFLDQLPSIIPLDSGIYAETLISNQPNWLYVFNGIDSNSEEIVGTKVLIPLSGGLIDLFVSKQISEDQQVIDFITGQCNMLEEDRPSKIRNMNSSFIENPNSMSDHIDTNNHFQPSQFSPAENLNLQDENYIDSVLQCNSAVNFMDTFSYNSEHKRKNDFFWDYSHVSSGFDDQTDPLQSLRVEETAAEEEQQGNEKDSIKHEGEQEDPLSDCSDQIDDEDCFKYQRRTGKGSHCKNLFAERNRRKKLNERLYNLRALVPVISKLDRASILGDAIEYVKQLEKQVKELKNELEEHSEDDGDLWSKPKCDKLDINDCHLGTSGNGNGNGNTTKQKQDLVTTNDKAQQMEPQVEVAQLDGNEFFVKVFSEHKAGGFVRLIEALNSLGLEVTNANVTSNRSLVSNVFKVEKKDSEIIQACDLRDFIMELTQDPSKGWPKMSKKTLDNDNGIIEFDHHQLCSEHINSYNFHHILLD